MSKSWVSSASVQGKVIEFWRAVEMFSPPAIPDVSPSRLVFDATPDEPLPWQPGHSLRRRRLKKHQTWRHTVYLGTYPREAVFAVLKPVFQAEAESFEERPSGDSALLAFVVSDKGVLLEDSAVLSACAWATARALDPGPGSADWLDGFGDLEVQFAAQLEEMCLGEKDDEPMVFEWAALAECLRRPPRRSESMGCFPSRASGFAVTRSGGGAPTWSTRTSSTASSPTISLASPTLPVGERSDPRCANTCDRAARSTSAPGSMCAPDSRRSVAPLIPIASLSVAGPPARTDRWRSGSSSPSTRPWRCRDSAGHLFAVNGPPGTGKTTMLRDLIAGLVTERAERLGGAGRSSRRVPRRASPLEDDGLPARRPSPPARADRASRWCSPRATTARSRTSRLRSRSGEAIDPAWRELARDVDYFPELAERAMRVAQRPDTDAVPQADESAWGLVAAQARQQQEPQGLRQRRLVARSRPTAGDRPPPPPALRDLLKAGRFSPRVSSWVEAVAAFERARDRVVAIRDERLRAREALDRIAELEAELGPAREAEQAAGEQAEASRRRREGLEGALRTREDERRKTGSKRARTAAPASPLGPQAVGPGRMARPRPPARRRCRCGRRAAGEAREKLGPLEEEVRAHAEAPPPWLRP